MNARLAIVASLFVLSVSGYGARAAPQMLGVVASAGPLPMTCDGEKCSVELSAFCLQQGRSGPHDGTAYQAVDVGPVTLVATGADGTVRKISAAPYVSFASARGYSAVSATVPESVRTELGAARLALVVGPALTLIPVAVADDPAPLTDQEIAEATHTFRAIASELFESSDRPQAVTAEVLNKLINALPQSAGGDTVDLAARDGLWSKVVGGAPSVKDPNPGKAQAALVFESCRRGATYVQGLTLRRCLEASHDALMSTVNAELWRITGAGS